MVTSWAGKCPYTGRPQLRVAREVGSDRACLDARRSGAIECSAGAAGASRWTAIAHAANLPIEAMQLLQLDGEAYKPVGKAIEYEGRTPKL
jgi:hypothetical protein